MLFLLYLGIIQFNIGLIYIFLSNREAVYIPLVLLEFIVTNNRYLSIYYKKKRNEFIIFFIEKVSVKPFQLVEIMFFVIPHLIIIFSLILDIPIKNDLCFFYTTIWIG